MSDSFFSDPSHEHTLPRNANVNEASSGQRARARSAVFTVCFHVWLLNGRWRLAAAELNFHGDKRVSDLARRRNFDERKPGGFSGYSTLLSGSGGKKKSLTGWLMAGRADYSAGGIRVLQTPGSYCFDKWISAVITSGWCR